MTVAETVYFDGFRMGNWIKLKIGCAHTNGQTGPWKIDYYLNNGIVALIEDKSELESVCHLEHFRPYWS